MESIEEISEDILPEGVRSELEAKCGREVIAIEIRKKVFAFRPPNRMENKRFQDLSARPGADKTAESEKLMLTCCVYPDPEALREHFDNWPMAIGSSSLAFAKACGLDIDILGK
jgi:hypothetical protein